MNQLEIKEVNFNGDILVGVKDNATNKVYAGVNWVCNSLGLDSKYQRDKIKDHEVLSKGCCTYPLPSNGGTQETTVLEIEYVPLWLATINPKIVKEEARQKLVEYQLKVKDILAEAFLGKAKTYDSQYVSVGEVAGYNKVLITEAKRAGVSPRDCLTASQKFAAQFGIIIPDEFIPSPSPYQYTLFPNEKP